MTHIVKYKPEHEEELLALLANEPDWSTFLGEGTIDRFKKALREGETYLYLSQGKICGYLRALVDGFGIYVSELYVAPVCRGNGYGSALLEKIKQAHPNQDVYVFSDEGLYYENLG